MAYNGRDCPHDRRSLCSDELIVIPEDHSNLCPLQATHTMGSSQDVILTDQRGSAMKLTIVDDSSSPGVLINSCGTSPDNPGLLVLSSAFCGRVNGMRGWVSSLSRLGFMYKQHNNNNKWDYGGDPQHMVIKNHD